MPAAAEPVRLAVENDLAVITIANPPVNALSAAVRAGLAQAIRDAAGDPAVTAIVIAAEGRTFIAGADITEFGKPPVPPSLPDVIATFDAVSKPIVAAIGGAALGGGLEVALGCHARIASARASLGLPEVRLGILPGAGGTQRLPRLVGAAPALKIMAEGEPVPAKEALALGIVDEVVDGDPLEAAKAKARALASAGTPPRRTRDLTEKLSEPEALSAFERAAEALAKRHPDNPSVAACIEAVRATFDLPFEQGMAQERAHFARLVQDPRSKAMRHIFFAEREAARVRGVGKDTRPRSVGRAAVVGAGTMGGGIAMCFANAGIPVTIIETDEAALQRGIERIGSTYDISVKRGSLDMAKRAERMALITGKVGLEAAGEADLVIEAVFEEMSLKQEIFRALDLVVRNGAVLATNTSYLDVDAIASVTKRPQDVLGMHFFSPANVMRLLEIVRGARTAPDALATALETGRKIGKIPVVVGVCHGFVGNRMLSARTAQAEKLLIEGALPQDVDAAITGFGFRMGPFAMGDLAGLDIGWRVRRATGKTAPVADALCEAGRFGQKTGKGYYLYEKGDRTARPDPDVTRVIEGVSARLGVTRRAIPREEIVERLIYPMINEGARILEEGIAERPGDIDIVWLNGYGWPVATGGPMFHADEIGLERIAERLDAFAEATGDDSLRPAPLLARLAKERRGFASIGGEKAA